MTKTSGENLLKVKEVAEKIRLHPQTLYQMCNNEQIPHMKIGETQRSIRFDVDKIDKWLEDREHQVSKTVVLEPVMAFSPKEYDISFLRSVSMSGKKGSGRWNYGFGGVMERKNKNGIVRFDIWYYDQERKIRQQVVKQATSKREALVALEFKRKEIFKKLYSDEPDKKKITFKDYCEKYLKEIELRQLKSRTSIELNIRKRFIPFFGDMDLDKITPGQVKDYILMRKGVNAMGRDRVISNSSLNVELANLKRIFSVAIEDEGYQVKNNPIKASLFLKNDTKPRDKVLTIEEEERLLKAAALHLKPAIVCAVNTGMRKMEIASLQWKNVSLKNRIIVVAAEHSKNGKAREIPINSVLLEEMKMLKRDNGQSSFVFTYERKKGEIKPIGDFKISWMKAIEKAGIQNFTFHGLRHTFASRLAAQGVHPFEAQKILGHSSIDMTKWYSHFNQKQLLKAVEKVNGSGVFKESQASV